MVIPAKAGIQYVDWTPAIDVQGIFDFDGQETKLAFQHIRQPSMLMKIIRDTDARIGARAACEIAEANDYNESHF